MSFLYWLEGLRVPVLNELMLFITLLGEETCFLVVALIVFWCVDKRRGYLLMSVGFVGTIFNQFLKLACRIPRPWVRDPGFTILEQAREGAGGYSFPSGHTQMAVGTYGSLAATEKRGWLKWCFIILAVLVSFSRMYIGVHTLADVGVSVVLGIALILLLRPVVMNGGERAMAWLLGGMMALGIGFLCYVELFPFPADIDSHNLASGLKNAYTMAGCVTGVIVVYYVQRKWLDFDTKAVWWVQILKCVLGLALVLLVKSGLKAPLDMLFQGHLLARSLRYFLVVTVAGLVWPLTFRFWSKIKYNACD